MKVKVLRTFVAYSKQVEAGTTADLPEEVAARVIAAGWAAPAELHGTEWPKHVGGGYYQLSNGEKIKGKDEAAEAQAKIDKG